MRSITTYSLPRILLFYWTWWLVWAFVQVLVLHRLGLSWRISFIDSFASNILMGVLGLISITIYRYYQPGRANRVYRFIYALGIATLFSVGFHWIMGALIPDDSAYQAFLEGSMPLRFISSLLILSFITLLIWVWNNMEEQKDREQKRNEAEQLVKEAELVKLRQQLQPHFLFNSLNSISALAGSKPDEARKMIQQLSDFLRGTLRKDEQRTVLLEEELDHLRLYLDIEKVRFGHRMQVDIEFTDSALSMQIPPLLLQPIVENAIKFGLYGTIGEIIVEIRGKVENGLLHIEVKNPFDHETQNAGKGTGFGLSSVQRRLFLLFGRNDLLLIEKSNNRFVTRLKIPQL